MTTHFILVVAGPTGVGKTTLSKKLSSYHHCAYLSEDEITKELFPDLYVDFDDYPDKLKIAEDQLFIRAKEKFDSGECLIIDQINVGKDYIEEIKKAFHKHLVIKVLWPPIETTIERDIRREGWTSGEIVIERFYKKFEALKSIIGEKNYIDNSQQTPEETLEIINAGIKQEQ